MARSPTTTATSQSHNGTAGSGAEDAKSRVMAAIGELVDAGQAEWSRTTTGEVELRLLSGEVFLLGEVSVTRVA